jgi:hypothetical protein
MGQYDRCFYCRTEVLKLTPLLKQQENVFYFRATAAAFSILGK